MLAQQAALDVTGQNVSNAATPGYARRVVRLETAPSNGAFGGVIVAGVSRTVDRLAAAQATHQTAMEGAAAARASALACAEAILAPPGAATIADKMASFFSAMTTLAQSPADHASRSSALSAAQSFAQTVSGVAAQLASQQADLLGQAQSVAMEVNGRLSRIAALNEQITSALGQGSSAADLLDQRDALVNEVAERIGGQTIAQPTGAITLLSSGVALVEGGKAASIAVGPDAHGALAVTVTYAKGGTDDITTGVTGGTLGGIREARDIDLKKTASELDQLAYDVAGGVNAAHAAGYGLDGGTGRMLFTQPSQVAGAARAMALSTDVAGKPSALAAAGAPVDVPGGNDVALVIAQLSTKPLSGVQTPAQAFASIALGLGSAKQAAESELSLRHATVAQANNLRETASGVSLDEEMINLTKYERAYQASMKVISTIDELLGDLVKGL